MLILFTVASTLLAQQSPVITSTYLGGGASEFTPQVAVARTGEVYVAGSSSSSDFPTTAGALDRTANGGFDIVVSKFDATGTTLLYSTYIGGSETEFAESLAIDAVGNAYIVGRTLSSNFPTTAAAFRPSYSGGDTDAFVAKLSADGSTLIYSTFLGGSDIDLGLGVAVNAAGEAYVTGTTLSTDFPTTPGVLDDTFNGGFQDAFVAKLNSTGSVLIYSTFVGGVSVDVGEQIAIDAAGHAHVVGYTNGSGFPVTAGAFDTAFNGGFSAGQDLWVAKLDPSAASLVYATYLGGSGREFFADIALDAAGNAHITTRTSSPDFPTTPGAFDSTFGGSMAPEVMDGVVAKLNAAGSALLYSTYLGGSGSDSGVGIDVDAAGTAYVVGATDSADFPVTCDCIDDNASGLDAFLTRLNPTGTALLFSTLIGGSGLDAAYNVATQSGIALAGLTDSVDFPTTAGAFDVTFNGGPFDLFAMKLNGAVLSPQGAIQQIAESVQALADAGSLNGGQANALSSKLEAAIQQLGKGNANAAENQLKAFTNQVNAFVKAGVLTATEAQPLITAAECNADAL